MLVDIWIPRPDGQLARSYVAISRVRRIRTDKQIVAGFRADIVRFGTLYECRLWQFNRGGFFVKWESVLTAGEERYRSYIEFTGAFATLLEQAVRCELIAILVEQYGELPLEDQFLEFSEEERDQLLAAPRTSFDDAVAIETIQPKRLHGSIVTFDATIGNAIKLKGMRVTGLPKSPRLMQPTSQGLSFRPYDLDEPLKYEIARRASNYLHSPPPQSTVDTQTGIGGA
jgi:hypothetical protein